MSKVPDWSGEFWEFSSGEQAVMAVSVHDQRQHRAPEGWTLDTIFSDEEGEAYLYRRQQ